VVDVVRAKNKVVTGDLSGTIRVWDVAADTPLDEIGSLNSEIISLDVSPDGKLVAAGSLDGSIGVWDVQTAQQVLQESMGGSLILDVAISQDNSKLFVSASGNKFFAIDLSTGETAWSTVDVGEDIIAIDLVQRMRQVITTTQQGMTRLVEGETGKVLSISGSLGSLPRDLVVLPYGNRVLMTSRDGAIHVWNIDNLGKIVSLPVTNELDGIAVSLDGTRVAVCGGSSVVHILDSVPSGRRLKELRR
jgi:WD40 repeat protein